MIFTISTAALGKASSKKRDGSRSPFAKGGVASLSRRQRSSGVERLIALPPTTDRIANRPQIPARQKSASQISLALDRDLWSADIDSALGADLGKNFGR